MSEIKVTLLIVTLNEIDGCRAIVPHINPNWCHQILFIDGGSTDGTVEWIEENGFQLYKQKKRGIRQGYKEAWHLIEGEAVITFSPDGNCIPEIIPNLIDKFAEGHDMVVGSRYLNGTKSEDDDILTGFGNWFFTKSFNLMFKSNYTDVMVIYRIYYKTMIRELGIDHEDAFSWVDKLFFFTEWRIELGAATVCPCP